MRVRAIKHCFASGGRRRAGQVFDYQPVQDEDGKDKPLPPFLEQVDLPATDPVLLSPKIPGGAPTAGDIPSDEPAPVNVEEDAETDPSVDPSFLS